MTHRLHFTLYLCGVRDSSQITEFRVIGIERARLHLGCEVVQNSRRYGFVPDCKQRWVESNAQLVGASGHPMDYGWSSIEETGCPALSWYQGGLIRLDSLIGG